MHSFFQNIEAKNKALQLYDKKLEALGVSYERIKVETSFGNTNILATGNPSNAPIILLHGSNGCAPVAIEALIGLVNDYRVYSIDVVGQPNFSEEIRPAMTDHSYGRWMHEILSRLSVKDAILVGISFGGFIGWKTLVLEEKRIAKTFLIAPAGIVNGHPLKMFWNIFLPMKLYRWRTKEKFLLRFLNALFTEQDDFAFHFLSNLFLYYEMDFSPIPLIKKSEAKKIKTPVYFIGAENDLLFPGQKLLQQARKLFPSIQEILLLKKSRHVPDQIGNNRIVEFIKAHAKQPQKKT